METGGPLGGHPFRDEATRLCVAKLATMIAPGFDPAVAFDEWSRQRIPALAWQRPVDLLETQEGLQLVLHALDAIGASVYL